MAGRLRSSGDSILDDGGRQSLTSLTSSDMGVISRMYSVVADVVHAANQRLGRLAVLLSVAQIDMKNCMYIYKQFNLDLLICLWSEILSWIISICVVDFLKALRLDLHNISFRRDNS